MRRMTPKTPDGKRPPVRGSRASVIAAAEERSDRRKKRARNQEKALSTQLEAIDALLTEFARLLDALPPAARAGAQRKLVEIVRRRYPDLQWKSGTPEKPSAGRQAKPGTRK